MSELLTSNDTGGELNFCGSQSVRQFKLIPNYERLSAEMANL